MFNKTYILAGLALAGLTACTQPAPTVVGPEPVADKYGNALYCPDPYVLQGNECVLVSQAATNGAANGGTSPAPGTDPEPEPEPEPGNGNQNQNQNENQNENNNQNQNQQQTG